jgi:hypothetical protein
MIEFNINNDVLIRLTDVGKIELKRQAAKLRAEFPGLNAELSLPKEDSDGWSKWQMHSLISQLGHMVNMGSELPFETNIKIDISSAK